MAKFCEECPMRGSIEEEVDGLVSGPYSFTANRWSYAQSRSGFVGSITDKYGGVSELIYLPHDSGLAETAIESRIESCTAPTVTFEREGLLRRTQRKLGCPAIGAMIVNDQTLRHHVMPDIRRAALSEAELKPGHQ